MRLSRGGIPTLLLVGSQDISPAAGQAHALEEFFTLQVPHVRVLDQPALLSAPVLAELCPVDRELHLQVLALPWVSHSEMARQLDITSRDLEELHPAYLEYLRSLLDSWLEEIDPELPTILLAHAAVEGAAGGSERSGSLGSQLIFPLDLPADPRFDYTALGYFHTPQNLHPERHPPVIYPGSIERVDFSEADQQKYFLIAEVQRGETRLDWRPLQNLRPFIDLSLQLDSKNQLNGWLLEQLPGQKELDGSILRVQLEYPRSWEPLIDFQSLEEHCQPALEYHLIKQPITQHDLRLSPHQAVGEQSPEELLDRYWQLSGTPEDDIEQLNQLAADIFHPEEEDPD
jgi:exonuclease SbcD